MVAPDKGPSPAGEVPAAPTTVPSWRQAVKDVRRTRGYYYADKAATSGAAGKEARVNRVLFAVVWSTLCFGLAILLLVQKRPQLFGAIAAVGMALLLIGYTVWSLRVARRIRERADGGDPTVLQYAMPVRGGTARMVELGTGMNPKTRTAVDMVVGIVSRLAILGLGVALVWPHVIQGEGFSGRAVIGALAIMIALIMLATAVIELGGWDRTRVPAGDSRYDAWYQWAFKEDPNPFWARRMALAAWNAGLAGANTDQAVAAARSRRKAGTRSMVMAATTLLAVSLVFASNWQVGTVVGACLGAAALVGARR